MVLSKPQRRAAFNLIFDVVLGHGDGSPLKTSLINNGFVDIYGLINIFNDDIDSLTYPDPQDMSKHNAVSNTDKCLIHVFSGYLLHCNYNGFPIGDNWTSITPADLDSFCVNTTGYPVSRHIPVIITSPVITPTLEAPLTPTISISKPHVMDIGELIPVIPSTAATSLLTPVSISKPHVMDIGELIPVFSSTPEAPPTTVIFSPPRHHTLGYGEHKSINTTSSKSIPENMLDASLLMPSSYRSLLSMILLWPSHLLKTTTSVGNSNARNITLLQTLQRMPSLLPKGEWHNFHKFLQELVKIEFLVL